MQMLLIPLMLAGVLSLVLAGAFALGAATIWLLPGLALTSLGQACSIGLVLIVAVLAAVTLFAGVAHLRGADHD